MGHRTISVDVEAESFESDDLISEVLSRFSGKGSPRFSAAEKARLIRGLGFGSLMSDFYEDSDDSRGSKIPIRSLNDLIKIDMLAEVWDDLTPQELEQKLKIRI